jgi:hypothetical protein
MGQLSQPLGLLDSGSEGLTGLLACSHLAAVLGSPMDDPIYTSHPNIWAGPGKRNGSCHQNSWNELFLKPSSRVTLEIPTTGMARTVPLLGHRRTCQTSPTGPTIRLRPVAGTT